MMARLIVLAVALAAAAAAQNQSLYHLKWHDLPRLVSGETVRVSLPAGVRLEGRVLSIDPDALRLEVRKTSDRRAYPKGEAIVPRSEVKRLLWLRHGVTWRRAGGGVGFAVGASLTIPFLIYAPRDLRPAAAAAALGVPTAIGYLLGRLADKGEVRIEIDPDPPGSIP